MLSNESPIAGNVTKVSGSPRGNSDDTTKQSSCISGVTLFPDLACTPMSTPLGDAPAPSVGPTIIDNASVHENETAQKMCSVNPNANDSRLLHNVDTIHDSLTGFWETTPHAHMQIHHMQISTEQVNQPQAHVISVPEKRGPSPTSHSDLEVLGPANDPIKRSVSEKPEGRNPDHSQESFLREIDEIHQKALTSTPRPIASLRADKGTSTVTEMATQTMPNEIYDPPVKKSELTSQMSYMDRALTNHERRLRANEVWCEREEEKVNKIDAELFTLYSELRVAHEALHDDHIELKKIVSDLLMISPNYDLLIAKGLVVANAPTEPNAASAPHASVANANRPVTNAEAEFRTLGAVNDQVISEIQGPLNLVRSVVRNGCSAYHSNREVVSKAATPLAQDAIQITAEPKPPNMELTTSKQLVKQGPIAPQIPRKVANVPTRPAATPRNAPNSNTLLAKGSEAKQGTSPAVKRAADKKRTESHIESFLKEAKRVIPVVPPKRTQMGNGRATPNSSPKRLTSTPSAPRPQSQPITLNNMFSVLGQQDSVQNPEATPEPSRRGITNSNVDISSPDDFPPLPVGGRVKSIPNRQAPNADIVTCDETGHDKTWADIDEEDNKTIDAFLASVDGGSTDILGAVGNSHPSSSNANPQMPSNHLANNHDANVPRNISPMSMLLNSLPSAQNRPAMHPKPVASAPPINPPRREPESTNVSAHTAGARPKTGPMYRNNRPATQPPNRPPPPTHGGTAGGARTQPDVGPNRSVVADPPREHSDRVSRSVSLYETSREFSFHFCAKEKAH